MNKSRFSIWIPKKSQWVIEAIELVRRKAEEQGLPLSEGDVIIAALEEKFEHLKPHLKGA